jgi:hypothetical protein
MPFPPAGEMVVTQNATSVTASTPGNTAAAASGWVLASGSSYITTANTSADTIVISFEFANTIGTGLWVTADGGIVGGVATVGGTNCIYFPPTAETGSVSSGTGLLEGVQAIPNWNVINGVATYRDGVTKAFDQSQAVGFTAQSGMTGLHLWNTAPNWLSFCTDGAAASGHVTVTFQ